MFFCFTCLDSVRDSCGVLRLGDRFDVVAEAEAEAAEGEDRLTDSLVPPSVVVL